MSISQPEDSIAFSPPGEKPRGYLLPEEHGALRITLLYVLVAAFWMLSSDWILTTLYGDISRKNFDLWYFNKSIVFVSFSALILHLGVRHLFTEVRRSERARLDSEAKLRATEAKSLADLKASEERFRALVDHAADPLFIYENSRGIVDVNRQACNSLGYTREELLSRNIEQLFSQSPELEQTFTEHYGEFPQTLESVIRRKDGTQYPVELRVGSVEMNGRRLVLAFARDITSRKAREEERLVFSRLALELTACDQLGKVAYQVRTAVDALWEWDAMFISVRRSGQGRFRMILEMDTVDGLRRNYPASNYDGAEHRGLEALHRGEPILLNRHGHADRGVELNSFGEVMRRSHSLMFVPIHVERRLVGIVSVQSYTVDKFSASDLQRLQRLSEMAGPALERCRAESRSRALSALGQRLGAATTPTQAARIIVEVADELLGWDACMFDLYSAEEDESYCLLTMDVVNGTRMEVAPPYEVSTPKNFMRRTIEEGSQLILRDPERLSSSHINAFGDVNRASLSLMWVPIRRADNVIALFSIQSYTAQAFDYEDLQLLQILADHCSGALERTRIEEALRKNDQRYRQAISEAGAVPYEFRYGLDEYVFMGEGIQKITGYSAGEITPKLWTSLVQETHMRGEWAGFSGSEASYRTRQGEVREWNADIRILSRDGDVRWVADSSIQLLDASGRPYGSLGILQDVTERKRAEAQLLHNAFHDELTGLPNRALLLDRLSHAIARQQRRPEFRFAVLFLDLDRFKTINDSLGHIAGDEVLKASAERLSACLRPGDTVARFAGDEFTMLIEDLHEVKELHSLAERIQSVLSRPLTIAGREVFTSASIGIAVSSPEYTDADDLLRDADNALYRAKAAGKARYEIFDFSMHAQVMEHLELENDLRRAVARDEFLLHYQPIINLQTGIITSFEALLRWTHPVRGLVTPDTFVSLAEETGLIRPIGWTVLRDACRQLYHWKASYRHCPQLNVNLSARQFAEPDLNRKILQILAEEGIEASNVRLEITESVLLDNAAAASEQLHELKASGFQIFLDDFGTGYSSLSYLHQLPIDGVKIDRSFIARIHQTGKDREIVRSIVLMASSLGIEVTAEGVCTLEQLELLREMNCSGAQGFLFSRPVAPMEAGELLLGTSPWTEMVSTPSRTST